MTTRSRRQTRRLRFDLPRHRWPQHHNDSVARAKQLRTLNGRWRALGRAFVTISVAVSQFSQSLNYASEQIAKLDAALEANRHLDIQREDVIREYESNTLTLDETARQVIDRETRHADLMAFRGFDMREDNTLV